MSALWTRAFWSAVAERAVKTAAQSALLTIGAAQLNVLTLDWANVAGFAAGGAMLSVLTSVASGAVTGGGPSATNAEVPASYAPRHAAPDGAQDA